MLKIKNGVLNVGEDSFDYIQFGLGERDLVVIPGLGDGIVTVKNKALPGIFMFHDYVRRFRITLISRKQNLEEDADTCTMADDQVKAMKALGIDKACVVGVSLGGMIAQHLAADYPEMVEKLVLVVTVPKGNEMLTLNVKRWMKYAVEGKYKKLMVDINEKAHPDEYLKHVKWTYPVLGRMAKKMDRERFYIQAKSCITHDAMDKLTYIDAPTLIIGGEEDETLGMEGSYSLAEEIWECKLKCFEHQGHALYEDEKDFHRVVLRFLK